MSVNTEGRKRPRPLGPVWQEARRRWLLPTLHSSLCKKKKSFLCASVAAFCVTGRGKSPNGHSLQRVWCDVST